MPAVRAAALRALLLVFSCAVAVALGEIALRIIYRDAGTRTLGGPGGRLFEHLTIHDDVRWPVDTGPKQPGVPRVMIVGDSITWGQGVRDWQDVWPNQLLSLLDRAGGHHEMAVFAAPGRDIPTHVEVLEQSAQAVQPDVFIYQWYINDIEVMQHRPQNARWWQQTSWHRPLGRASYLYYFLDNRLTEYLPQPDRSYVDYLLQDFIPGSIEWAEFERYFHALAARAKESAPIRLLIIYPQVPFRGTPPLQSLYDRLRAMTGAHRLAIPPAAWIRFAGTVVKDADAPWREAVQVPASAVGPVIETRDYYLPPGPTDLVATLKVQTGSQGGTIDVIDHATNQIITSVPLSADAGKPGWQEITLHLHLPGDRGRAVRFRDTAAGAAFSLASLEVPVDYGMVVIDLDEPLNGFNTHTSIFDAHPNAAAHKVIAEKAFAAMQKAERHH